jgi:hypothetical protein
MVFGSNLSGVHGKGAAKYAKDHYGAKQGVAHGRQGDSYAIATRGWYRGKGVFDPSRLELNAVEDSILRFREYARRHLELPFVITRIGCGNAGFKDNEIAPLFVGSPANCEFDPVWASFGLKSWTEAP